MPSQSSGSEPGGACAQPGVSRLIHGVFSSGARSVGVVPLSGLRTEALSLEIGRAAAAILRERIAVVVMEPGVTAALRRRLPPSQEDGGVVLLCPSERLRPGQAMSALAEICAEARSGATRFVLDVSALAEHTERHAARRFVDVVCAVAHAGRTSEDELFVIQKSMSDKDSFGVLLVAQ